MKNINKSRRSISNDKQAYRLIDSIDSGQAASRKVILK